MAEVSGAQIVARILKEEGVEWISGIHGGNVFDLLKATDEQNIKMLHMRHEQSAVYLCDGWGRVSQRPGVCFSFAPPGFFNMVGGLAHALLCRSPLVALVGQRPAATNELRNFYGYAEDVCRTITKRTTRILDVNTISYHLQKAFRDAVAYPPGPVVIELSSDLQTQVVDEKKQIAYLPKERSADLDRGAGDAATIEKAVRMLLEAERPLVMAGDGIFWSQASEELKEFVELLRIPVHTRRMGRGAVSEDHPLSFRGGYSRPLMYRADVIVVLSLLMDRAENFGQPPAFSHQTKYILVSESMEELEARLPTEVRILANPKVVLRQMIDCAKDLMKEPPPRSEWLATVEKGREVYTRELREQAEKGRHDKPINSHFLAQEVADFLDDSATVIFDSFMMSHFASPALKVKFAGQVLDAPFIVGVGHSIGMAMGAQLARPGKQVLAFVGDGGFGIAGFDLETAARYKIPAVYLLFNNSGWMNPTMQSPDYHGRLALPIKDSWGMLPDIRYDKIVEELSCHGEWVTEPEQIRPALERSFNSGKPSVINVIPDITIIPPFLTRGVGGGM